METGKRKFTVTKTGGLIPSLFRGWGDYESGDSVTAEYISTKMGEYNGKPTPNHLVKVIECNFTVTKKDGTEVDPVGQNLTLNSAGQLNKLIEDLEPGAIISFEYGGKQKSSNPKDKQLYHTFTRLEAGYIEESDASDAL